MGLGHVLDVDPESDGVIDEQIPGGPRITDHEDCQKQIQELTGI